MVSNDSTTIGSVWQACMLSLRIMSFLHETSDRIIDKFTSAQNKYHSAKTKRSMAKNAKSRASPIQTLRMRARSPISVTENSRESDECKQVQTTRVHAPSSGAERACEQTKSECRPNDARLFAHSHK